MTKVKTEQIESGYHIKVTGETVPYSEVLVSQDSKFWRCQKPDGSRRCAVAGLVR